MQVSDSWRVVSYPRKPGFSYEPTILSSAGLFSRLSVEVRFLVTTLRSSWLAFKEKPIQFALSTGVEFVLTILGRVAMFVSLPLSRPLQ